MQPGWLVPCFDVADLARSLEFYAGLGFRNVGGNLDDGWAVVANGPIELGLFRGHFQGWMLNFRGADVPALARQLAAQGVAIEQQSAFDPTHAPPEWSIADGSPLPTTECGDCLLRDPDGRTVYLDTVPVERARFLRHELYASEGYDGSYLPGQPQLGTLRVELTTPDVSTLAQFYLRLGLAADPPAADGSVALSSPGQSWRIVLLAGSGAAGATFTFGTEHATARQLNDPGGYRVNLQ